jgi:hypothetical protein
METMIPASMVSLRMMRKIGTENTFLAIVGRDEGAVGRKDLAFANFMWEPWDLIC